MCVTAIAGLAGGLMQSSSASNAADAQAAAGQQQIDFQQGIYDSQVGMFAPYVGSGNNALAALNYELGLGPRPTATNYTIEEITDSTGAPVPAGLPSVFGGEGSVVSPYGGGRSDLSPYSAPQPQAAGPSSYFMVGDRRFDTYDDAQAWVDQNQGFDYQGYEPSNWYQTQFDEGIRAIDSSAASRGNLFSGATLQSQQDRGQQLASADYQNYLAQLYNMAGMGQNSVAQQATAAQNLGTGVTNALGSIGNAQAAGSIASGNAWAGAMNNLGGWYGYQQASNGGNNAGVFDAPWASGGFWG